MDPAAVLDAWRVRGEQRRDPVRFRFIEALARRASAHGGDARRILDDRLATLLAAYRENLEKAQCADSASAVPDGSAKQAARLPRGPLAELVDHMARQAPLRGDDPPADDAAPTPELRTLRYFRSTWSRLSADRRLTQSLAKVPENAGPLNSHHLVHRSLMLMHELSPEYLNRFMSYVDTLLWVDQLNAGNGPAAAANAPRAEGQKKTARGKPG
ncbi:hypothetical protein VAPA_1c33430 [Variovorax paradoxus B4]|uniref:DUF2894 domain-containing protein n=1 Tax=Variovorax paradoxus B4 TaxID=1246301 RepID=T1XDL6_VARPD|nr:DUF2894 domain-containing protein [Variovorax paradoxus]AGU50429.1 hypothetical protein VAPA_1c33430 [Variovorax paradoxus B4]